GCAADAGDDADDGLDDEEYADVGSDEAALSARGALVASLNVQEGRDARGRPALERQIACLRRLRPDIVLLQESALPGDERGVHTRQPGGENNATEVARALGMRFEGTAETADTSGAGPSLRLHYGVAILWRPALGLHAHDAYVPAR